MVVSYVPVQFVFLFVNFIAGITGVDHGYRVMQFYKMLAPFVVASKYLRTLRAFVP